jgi:chromosome segregation ATPase
MHAGTRCAAAILLSAVLTHDAFAQAARPSSGGQQALQQLQQLASERTALQSENARLKEELAAARQDAERFRGEADRLRGRVSSSDAEAVRARETSRTAESSLQATRARLDELVTRFRETGETLRAVEADRTRLQTELAQRNREFDTCAASNAELYRIGSEALDRLENTGFWTRAAQAEPFTRVSRNRLENLVDAYRARAEELRVGTAAGVTPVSAPDAGRP